MNPDQATELGKRIINTMRPTPALVEWQDVLEHLDLDDALLTFKSMRDEVDGGLTIGRFLGAYRGRVETRRLERDRHRPPPPRCELCDGTGWVDAPPLLAHRSTTCRGEPGTDTCHCHAVTPCQCSRGNRMNSTEARIHEANIRSRQP